MKMFTFTTIQILLVVITGVLTYPSIEIRRSYQEQAKAFRVGYCKFDESEHTQCYVCARLYDSFQLYKECCYREPQTAMCGSLR